MTATVELKLSGNLDHLRVVWQTGETLLESVPFRDDPEGTRYNILVAVQEMITNVLRHAYAEDIGQPLEVRFHADEVGFTAEIRDRGPAFNPLLVQAPTLTDAEVPLVVGGWGIAIAREVMDELDYRLEHGWNVLTMWKGVAVPAEAVEARDVRAGGS